MSPQHRVPPTPAGSAAAFGLEAAPLRRLLSMAASLALLLALAHEGVQATEAAKASAGATSAQVEVGPKWSSLTAQQQAALAPLAASWAGIDLLRKQKWLEVASHFDSLPAADRARAQERMAAWAALSPAERARARFQFQESRTLGADERRARWEAYQALPPEEKRRLAQQARRNNKPHGPANVAAAAASGAGPATKANVSAHGVNGAPGADVHKRNLVTAQSVQATRPISPTTVQTKPGATTSSMVERPLPPAHNQPGLPKIVATPTFVDPTTLLPRRGPQGAAALRVAASAPLATP